MHVGRAYITLGIYQRVEFINHVAAVDFYLNGGNLDDSIMLPEPCRLTVDYQPAPIHNAPPSSFDSNVPRTESLSSDGFSRHLWKLNERAAG